MGTHWQGLLCPPAKHVGGDMIYCLEVANSDDIKKVVMQALKESLEGILAMRKPRTPETTIKISTQR